MRFTQANVTRLMQEALSQTGLAIIPQLQQALQAELANDPEVGPDQAASLAQEAFSDKAFLAMKEGILAELTQSFSKASLAAISELAAARQNPLVHDVNTTPDFFENASESGDETTAAERHRSLTPAKQGPETPEGPPAGSAPPLTEGGMPVTPPGQKPGQKPGQPGQPEHHAQALRRQHQQAAQPAPEQAIPGAEPTDASPSEGTPDDHADGSQFQYAGTPEQQLQHQLRRQKELVIQGKAEQEVRDEVNAIKEKHKPGSTRGYASNQSGGGQPTGTTPDTGDPKQRALMKAAQAVAGKLTHNIKNGVMDNWELLLSLAVLKDALDYAELLYFDPGVTGMIVDIVAKLVFAALIAAQKDTFRKRLVKKYVTRILAAICIEFIPIANEWVPAYTIDVVTIYIDCQLTRQKEQGYLGQVQSMMKRFKNKRRRMGPKTMRNYRQQINDIDTQADR